MIFIVSVVAGIVPMLIYPFILYWFDRYEKEPLGMLLAVFVWGFVPSAIFALITQVILDLPLSVFFVQGTLGYDFVAASIFAPLTEEIAKGAAVFLVFLLFRHEFDSLFDGIIYGALVGFGFAAIENILYFSTSVDMGELTVLIFLRAVLFGLNHAMFTSFTGIGFAIARLSRNGFVRFVAPLGGLLLAMVAHGLHNAGATLQMVLVSVLIDWLGVAFVFVIILLSISRERQWLVQQLRDEVSLGTLTEAQYAALVSPAKRAQVRGKLAASGRTGTWRKAGQFYHVCTELAYKKHQNAKVGERGATPAMIEALRQRAALLSKELG